LVDPAIQDLISTLSAIPNPDREDIIRKIKLFAENDAKQHQTEIQKNPYTGKETKIYLPKLSRLDVVHCDFTGVGFEWDGPHYALVWNVNPAFDSVTVIPTTSESREEYANVFDVGQIQGLPIGKTTLLVADTTTVSRKRLSEIKFKHPKKGVINARLANAWLDRIFQAMSVTFGNEITFQDFVLRSTGVAMPIDLQKFRLWRFVPIHATYDSVAGVLNYRIWNQEQYHKAEFILPKQQISVGIKQQLVRDLFSTDPTVRAAAEDRYQTLYLGQP
jgi:hypothetical protein